MTRNRDLTAVSLSAFPGGLSARADSSARRLTAEATVLTVGRRVIHLEAKTHDDTGRIVASATASFAVIAPVT
jgi:hypothetical protein